MFKQALWFGFGCSLLACGGSSDSPAGAGGTGNTAGFSSSGGMANAGSPGAGAGGAGASAAGSAGSAGLLSGGAAGAGAAGAGAGAAGAGGAGGTNSAGGASGAAGAPGTMAAVQAVFDDRCVVCHDSTKVGLPSYPQLSLTTGNARAALVNRQALEACGGTLVVPGSPDQSYLIHKLSDATPCDGARMPRAFEVGVAPPLTAQQLATIRSWISAGAKP